MLSKRQLTTALGLAAAIVVITKAGGCSSGGENKAGEPQAACGTLNLNDEKVEQCPGGTGVRTLICTERGLQVAIDQCSGNGGGGNGGGNGGGVGGDGGNNGGSRDCRVSFTEVKPILTTNCVSCHQSPTRIDEYGTARAWAQKNVTRVNLAPQDNRRMPLPPREPLSASDKAILKAWADSGTPEKCDDDGDGDDDDGRPQRAPVSFGDIERTAAIDLQTRVDSDDYGDTIYLDISNKWNEGATDEELKTYRRAIDKTLNGVNPRGADIVRATPVPGSLNTLYRVNISDYEIDNVKFKVLTDNDKLPIISVTDDGAILKQLTGRVQAIFSADNFMQLAQFAPVYHALTETPATLAQYQQLIGINLNADLAALDAQFVGTTTSPITNLKNRLSVRTTEFKAGTGRTSGAYFWMTFDTIPTQPIAARNLFNFPLLTGTGGNSVKNFLFDQSETIASAPNGFQLYQLWQQNGARQDAQPNSIVRDSSSPIDFNIKNQISCSRCHSAGIIPMVDQVRDHVLRNASQFGSNDVNLVKAVYPVNDRLKQIYAADQGKFARALAAIDVDPAQPDPQSFVFDRFFLDWDLRITCSYLRLPDLAECRQRLDQSPTARSEIGQILTGGLITYEQFKDVYAKLVDEMSLYGRDDL